MSGGWGTHATASTGYVEDGVQGKEWESSSRYDKCQKPGEECGKSGSFAMEM